MGFFTSNTMYIPWKKLLVEFIGAAVLVSAILLSHGSSIIVGATLASAIYLGAVTSGAHYNPAVSLAMGIRGSLTWPMVGLYSLSQFAGGAVGFGVYKAVTH